MEGGSFRCAAPGRTCRSAPAAGENLDGTSEPFAEDARAPEPAWPGPGEVVALGMTDGRHRMGMVRAVAWMPGWDAPAGAATLLRLLAHYGLWMGFEGEVEAVGDGHVRTLPMAVGPAGRIEYRVEVRRILRCAQRLVADGTVLVNGHPAAVLEGLSIAFRPARDDRARSAA